MRFIKKNWLFSPAGASAFSDKQLVYCTVQNGKPIMCKKISTY
jgi:hypothetical protein